MATALRLPERDVLFEARAKKYLKDTHSPETLEGVVSTKPPKGAVPVLIFDIILKRARRIDRAAAPCPICCPKAPKWLQGAFAWFPHEGVYRCIGIECIAHLCGVEKAHQVKREFDTAKSIARDYEFAFENVLLAPRVKECLEALMPAAEHAEGLRRELGKSQLRSELWRLYKQHEGRLRVWEEKEVERFNSKTNAVESKRVAVPVEFGAITGPTAIMNDLHLVRDLRVQIGRISVFCVPDAQQRVLDSYHDHHSLGSFRRAMAESQKLATRVVAKASDVLAFFDEANFERLRKFGEDFRSPVSICASVKNGAFKIGPTFTDSVTIRPNFRVLDGLPEWPSLTERWKSDD